MSPASLSLSICAILVVGVSCHDAAVASERILLDESSAQRRTTAIEAGNTWASAISRVVSDASRGGADSGQGLARPQLVASFYERRAYKPAWGLEESRSSLRAAQLMVMIARVEDVGLRPVDYHSGRLASLLASHSLVEFDVWATDAFLMLAQHLLQGRMLPSALDPDWRSHADRRDVIEELEFALLRDGVEGALKRLLPSDLRHWALVEARRRYAQIVEKGGWQEYARGVGMGDPAARARTPVVYLGIVGRLGRRPTPPGIWPKIVSLADMPETIGDFAGRDLD